MRLVFSSFERSNGYHAPGKGRAHLPAISIEAYLTKALRALRVAADGGWSHDLADLT